MPAVCYTKVLRDLHAAMLTLSSSKAPAEAVSLLADTHRQIADLLRAYTRITLALPRGMW